MPTNSFQRGGQPAAAPAKKKKLIPDSLPPRVSAPAPAPQAESKLPVQLPDYEDDYDRKRGQLFFYFVSFAFLCFDLGKVQNFAPRQSQKKKKSHRRRKSSNPFITLLTIIKSFHLYYSTVPK